MLKELKEDMDRHQILCEQNGNINKERENFIKKEILKPKSTNK